jgi:nicotinamidase-related amidase
MRTALLLIDLQNDYFPGGRMELAHMDAAAAQAGKLLEAFRRRQLPTCHIQHVAIRPGATFFVADTPGAEIHRSIAPQAGEAIVVKHYPNSFRETDLLAKLREWQVARVVICGAMSHMCIDATTRAAADYGFECTVVQGACATRDLTFGELTVPAPQVHAAFMAALGSFYARITSLQDFLNGIA